MYSLLMYLGFGSGTKNSAADRSGIPISHTVGPSRGGSYTILPTSMSQPGFGCRMWLMLNKHVLLDYNVLFKKN